jgi:hypothetical protein
MTPRVSRISPANNNVTRTLVKNERKQTHPSIEPNYAASRHEVETTTTQPLCDVGRHTEKRKIEELVMIEQTEKKREQPRGVGIHTSPCVVHAN